ncbi:hypothetical protein ACODNH_05000 [Haloarcula sp. NS06]|uniref:hypothetical protein n=1 Tax=unclassified Haloarcula TaxID=2624677 RepID=UPI0027B149BC|nr:hypothetical protein [Haloarcula sp. H-GB4]MDQ2072858.1 hypothetical protein [Haloarcula sp. H-GB4]
MLLSLELVLGILFVILSGLIVLSSSGFFGFVSPTGIFYGLFVVFIYVGTILIHYGVTLWYAVPVESHPLILGGAIFAFALGTVAPNYLLEFEPFNETRKYASKEPVMYTNRNVNKYVLALICVLILWIVAVYLRSGSPLLSTISFRAWAATHSWSLVGITLFLPFITLLTLVYGYAQQDSLIWCAGIIALITTLTFMILTSRRYPVLDFGIWTICLISYLRFRSYSEMTRILLGSALVVIPFFLGISLIRNPRPGAFENILIASARQIRNRIFLSEATSVNYILTAFPRTHRYFGIEFFLDRLVSVLPGYGHSQSFGEELYDTVFAGDGGFLPPTFIGKLYFSAGKLGLVGLFAWGVLLQTTFIAFVRIQKTPLTVVLFAVVSGLLGRSLIQGFLSPINRIKYVFILIFPLVLIAFKLPEVKLVMRSEQ